MDDLLSLPVIVSASLILAGALAQGIFSVINKRTDVRAAKEPTQVEIWARIDQLQVQLDTEHSSRLHFEILWRRVKFAWMNYIERVQDGGSLELTADERKIIDNDITVKDKNNG